MTREARRCIMTCYTRPHVLQDDVLIFKDPRHLLLVPRVTFFVVMKESKSKMTVISVQKYCRDDDGSLSRSRLMCTKGHDRHAYWE